MAKTDTRRLDTWARLRQVAQSSIDHEGLREAAILDARDAGWSYAQIGSALGVTAQSVHKFVQRRTNRDRG